VRLPTRILRCVSAETAEAAGGAAAVALRFCLVRLWRNGAVRSGLRCLVAGVQRRDDVCIGHDVVPHLSKNGAGASAVRWSEGDQFSGGSRNTSLCYVLRHGTAVAEPWLSATVTASWQVIPHETACHASLERRGTSSVSAVAPRETVSLSTGRSASMTDSIAIKRLCSGRRRAGRPRSQGLLTGAPFLPHEKG
jgi:hypothetical protein